MPSLFQHGTVFNVSDAKNIQLTIAMPFFPDIDECQTKACAKDAKCKNTDGSYECTCMEGFQGNGSSSCSGIF